MALRHVVSSLTLEQAIAIATIAAGRRERMLPLAVVVVDAGGQVGGGARLRSARARPRLAGVVPVARVLATVTRPELLTTHRYGERDDARCPSSL